MCLSQTVRRQLRALERLRDGWPIARDPRLQLPTRDPNERGRTTRLGHEIDEPLLHLLTIGGILIAEHHKSRIRSSPPPEPSHHLCLQVLLALEHEVIDRECRREELGQ